MLICDKCGAQIPPDAKFCPQCADPVTEADRPATDVEQPDSSVPTITIEFGHSSSSRYEQAVEMAQRIPSHDVRGEGSEEHHSVSLEATDVGLAGSLWDLVGNWKTSRMSIDGQRITKKDLTYGALGCYQKRQEAFQPGQYCYGEDEYRQNLWGCHQLGLPLSGWRESWFTWGQFDSEGRWHWDKDRLRHELEKGLHECRYCPVLGRHDVLATLDSLPDGVNPRTSRSWNYIKDWSGEKEVPIGIVPTLATAKRLAAGKTKPDWEHNSSLDNATSKLEDYSRLYEAPASTARRSSGTTSAKSGCMVVLFLAAAGGATSLLLAILLHGGFV